MAAPKSPLQDNTKFDWRKNTGHLLLLTTFIEPRPPNQCPIDTNWVNILGEPPEQAVNRLLGAKALRVCGVSQILRHELPKLTAEQLRGLLHERGLPVSGNKQEMVERLTQRFEPSLLLVVSNRYLLECSDQGKELAENYLQHGIEAITVKSESTAEDVNPEAREATKETIKWLLKDVLLTSLTYEALKNIFIKLWPDEPLPTPDVKPEPVPSPPKEVPQADKTRQPPQDEARQPESRDRSAHEPEMVHVPAGYFWMGSERNDPDAWDDEKPIHQVYVQEYWIGRYLVTVAQFTAFIRDTGYETIAEKKSDEWTWRQPRGAKSHIRDKADHPVTQVSWEDALEYCSWLTRISGQPYTLPSEAEWEKAARGTDGRIYPWGNQWDARRCNTYENGKYDTTPVGTYSPDGDSLYGCADMAGNVWEWTRSLWGKRGVNPEYKYPYQADDGRENPSASRETQRVQRGGSFNHDRRNARCAFRYGDFPDLRDYDLGFRVVVSPFDPGL